MDRGPVLRSSRRSIKRAIAVMRACSHPDHRRGVASCSVVVTAVCGFEYWAEVEIDVCQHALDERVRVDLRRIGRPIG
jgi:hypothetical protein